VKNSTAPTCSPISEYDYEGKVDSLVWEANDFALKVEKFYESRKVSYRIVSWIIRTLSVIFYVFGILLSFVKVDEKVKFDFVTDLSAPFGGFAETAVVLVILASIIVVVDERYLASSNWKRFSLAFLKINGLKTSLKIDIQSLKIRSTGSFTPEVVDEACEICSTFVAQVQQARLEETEAWAKALDKSHNDFKSSISAASANAQATLKEAQKRRAERQQAAAAREPGFIRVILMGYENIDGQVLLQTEGVSKQAQPQNIIILKDVPSHLGAIVVNVIYKLKGSTESLAKANVVKPKAQASVDVTFEI
jgi:hypothetical protein